MNKVKEFLRRKNIVFSVKRYFIDAMASSGMGACGFVGQIGVYSGWVNDIANGAKAAITGADWAGLILVSFVLPAILTWLFAIPLRKWGWIKDGDLKLNL